MAESLFLSRDNTIDLILKEDGVAVDTSGFTSITLSFDAELVTSSNAATGAIMWNQSGYATGEIRIDAGAETITAGTYDAVLIVRDATNTNGIRFGTVSITVAADDEAAA